jgi:hypothetical protein
VFYFLSWALGLWGKAGDNFKDSTLSPQFPLYDPRYHNPFKVIQHCSPSPSFMVLTFPFLTVLSEVPSWHMAPLNFKPFKDLWCTQEKEFKD